MCFREIDKEWKHAVRCSQRALDDEKKAIEDYWDYYGKNYIFTYDEIDKDRIMKPYHDRIKEAQHRIASWQQWFNDRG